MKSEIRVVDIRPRKDSGKLVALFDIEVAGHKISECPLFVGKDRKLWFTGPTMTELVDGEKKYEVVVKLPKEVTTELQMVIPNAYDQMIKSGKCKPVSVPVCKRPFAGQLTVTGIVPTPQHRQLAGFCAVRIDGWQFERCRVMHHHSDGSLKIVGPGWTSRDDSGNFVEHLLVSFSETLQKLLDEAVALDDFTDRIRSKEPIMII